MAQDQMTGRPTQSVRVPVGEDFIRGDLRVPANPHAVVLFAHGSGSSRHSPRNQ